VGVLDDLDALRGYVEEREVLLRSTDPGPAAPQCLREDLGQPIPRADTPLDEVPHPLLEKASERFADDSTPHERIASVDDHVLFKG